MRPTKIALRNVSKQFGTKQVLRGLSLEVAAGESLVIIGASGSGKSVTIKCVLGLIQPDKGEVLVDDIKLATATGSERANISKQFGMLFQGGALFDSLPVWHNVAFGLMQGQGMKAGPARRIAIEMLARVGLGTDVANLRPSELSGGMQKRVGLARAIAARPQVIFFDEPTTGLDPIMADVINELISRQVKELGCTAVTITHDMSSVRKIADRVAMIHDGVIIWQGPRSAIDNSGNPYVEQFVKGLAQGPIQMDILRK